MITIFAINVRISCQSIRVSGCGRAALGEFAGEATGN
jgi:hypothetical protein